MMDYVQKYRYYLSGKERENYLLLVSIDPHLLFMAAVTMCTSDLGGTRSNILGGGVPQQLEISSP